MNLAHVAARLLAPALPHYREPFQVETGDVAVTFTTKITKPHWTAPDHIDAGIKLGRVADMW